MPSSCRAHCRRKDAMCDDLPRPSDRYVFPGTSLRRVFPECRDASHMSEAAASFSTTARRFCCWMVPHNIITSRSKKAPAHYPLSTARSRRGDGRQISASCNDVGVLAGHCWVPLLQSPVNHAHFQPKSDFRPRATPDAQPDRVGAAEEKKRAHSAPTIRFICRLPVRGRYISFSVMRAPSPR